MCYARSSQGIYPQIKVHYKTVSEGLKSQPLHSLPQTPIVCMLHVF